MEEKIFNSLVAGLGAFLIFFVLILIAALVVQIIATVKLYKKAGKEGWEAIVPFYSTWVLCEIAGLKWWMVLIMLSTSIVGILGLVILEPLAALASLAATFACHYNIAIKFNKDAVGYGLGLTFLPIIFYSILGFGNATFTDKEVSPYGPIKESKVEEAINKVEEKTTNKKTTTNGKFCKNCGAPIDGDKFCGNCGKEVN